MKKSDKYYNPKVLTKYDRYMIFIFINRIGRTLLKRGDVNEKT